MKRGSVKLNSLSRAVWYWVLVVLLLKPGRDAVGHPWPLKDALTHGFSFFLCFETGSLYGAPTVLELTV